MKTLIALVALSVITAGRADDIKTISGKDYKNVTVSRVEPDGIVIIASYGIIKIPFEELSPELQQKYHFDPAAAANFRHLQDTAEIKRQEATDAALKRRAAELETANTAHASSLTPQPRPTAPNAEVHEPQQPPVRHTGEKYFVQGHPIQVIEDEGILISTVKSTSLGMLQPKDGSLVFVLGKFDPTLDSNDSVAMNAIAAGTHKYVTVQGASKTVAQFQFASNAPIQAPLDPSQQR